MTKRKALLWSLLVLIVVGASAQDVKSLREGGPMPGIDLPGEDIKKIVLTAPPPGQFDIRDYQCANECWTNPQCRSWTYVRPNTIQGPHGNCYLKKSTPARVQNSCCISGIIGQSDTDRPGGDYKNFIAAAPQQCATACFNEAKCKAWTFVRPNTIQGPQGRCWLKSTIPQPTKNACCISGSYAVTTIH